MGAGPWQYSLHINRTFRERWKLRNRNSALSRFRGSELEPATIEEAFENMDADGTASILDIERVPMNLTFA